ncbi:hypothetical protein J2847_005839 [Azospirillum agricola]|uniref:hypothetical protein n=1 Tax=Azospirillum agricola TaxID=1720247 RepID=UPI001AE4531D|nr:hypothetical protein [Azospirillum agricola]MBP2232510.1 hypothetical protein [Azospirillum agricola]
MKPAIIQHVEAPCPSGAVSLLRGRAVRIIRSAGTDAAAPVIVEELQAVGVALPGQLGIWPAAEVAKGLGNLTKVRRKA